MKSYPHISQNFIKFDAYVFDKLDGSNLRFEWNKKKGWNKFGTRTHLFDETDKIFGKSIPIFYSLFSDKLEKIAIDNRWEQMVVFCEFYGTKSFAGIHYLDDIFNLSLFDIDVYKKGLLSPKEFIRLCGNLQIASFLGNYKWTRGFIEMVRLDEIPGITFEGVVGKAQNNKIITMAKAKTQQWRDKVKEVHGLLAEKIINS